MHDFADDLRGPEPRSRIRPAALIFAAIIGALIWVGVIAAVMRMVGV